jgi:hypothetical protein
LKTFFRLRRVACILFIAATLCAATAAQPNALFGANDPAVTLETPPNVTPPPKNDPTYIGEGLKPIAKPIQVGDAELTPLQKGWLWFSENVSVISFMTDPSFAWYHTGKKTFQHLLGYNELYDRFAWTFNCYIDTIRVRFEYAGKEWMIQAWKGGYGIILFNGGEVGIYTRPKNSNNPLYKSGMEHYSSAEESDWLPMQMTLYVHGKPMLTRPLDKYWWATGFSWGTVDRLVGTPRSSDVLDTYIEFKDTGMANAFLKALRAKGFRQVNRLALSDSESYVQSGARVRWIWRNVSESFY